MCTKVVFRNRDARQKHRIDNWRQKRSAFCQRKHEHDQQRLHGRPVDGIANAGKRPHQAGFDAVDGLGGHRSPQRALLFHGHDDAMYDGAPNPLGIEKGQVAGQRRRQLFRIVAVQLFENRNESGAERQRLQTGKGIWHLRHDLPTEDQIVYVALGQKMLAFFIGLDGLLAALIYLRAILRGGL